jgi:hypothetical protein
MAARILRTGKQGDQPVSFKIAVVGQAFQPDSNAGSKVCV